MFQSEEPRLQKICHGRDSNQVRWIQRQMLYPLGHDDFTLWGWRIVLCYGCRTEWLIIFHIKPWFKPLCGHCLNFMFVSEWKTQITKNMSRLGFELGSLDSESQALTTRPCGLTCLGPWNWVKTRLRNAIYLHIWSFLLVKTRSSRGAMAMLVIQFSEGLCMYRL